MVCEHPDSWLPRHTGSHGKGVHKPSHTHWQTVGPSQGGTRPLLTAAPLVGSGLPTSPSYSCMPAPAHGSSSPAWTPQDNSPHPGSTNHTPPLSWGGLVALGLPVAAPGGSVVSPRVVGPLAIGHSRPMSCREGLALDSSQGSRQGHEPSTRALVRVPILGWAWSGQEPQRCMAGRDAGGCPAGRVVSGVSWEPTETPLA